ncbi:transposase [uncultured Thiodictyon sp.]|jgi:putative transposase|uniref:REP-associated tyrosine transposase n=1 Tax=uncultured Thiodictyon sp. TaxID=1846217 RepID=UPI0025E777C5|nr:transposase [uncultured Thiodictyon sp.]
MKYRRAILPGGTFFFTLVTQDRRPQFTDPESIDCLREAFRAVKKKRPFRIDAIVIMPDHLHCIWTLPGDDADYSLRWRLVKTWVTKHWPRPLPTPANPARCARGERALWQHRYWEHVIRDEEDFSRHVDYIHYNPVKHGYVDAVADWPYSSFLRFVDAGLYPRDWACKDEVLEGVGHE